VRGARRRPRGERPHRAGRRRDEALARARGRTVAARCARDAGVVREGRGARARRRADHAGQRVQGAAREARHRARAHAGSGDHMKWLNEPEGGSGGAWVGQPLERVDAQEKVTGRAKYSAEVPVAGVAYAVMVTSAIAKGRIVDIDAGAALKAPGVFTVLTHQNAMRLPGGGQPADAGDRVVQVLQDDRILYSNQPVALVVADTFERATHAAFSVRVHTQAEPF